MAPLPAARVTPGVPLFSSVGIDYFGPLKAKWRRDTAKRYECIFTCLAIRAIHIEISHDLTTDSFLQAVCRFVSRRGPPREIFSDNGSNFQGAEVEVKEALKIWDEGRIPDRLRERGIEWHFSPPAASHAGGVWERMIRTTRKTMRALVGNCLLEDETLLTVACEAEKIINDRPLTRQCDDPLDFSVLTPNTLLLGYRDTCNPPCDVPAIHHPRPNERWKQAQTLADTFWKRWTREYLPTLQERQKWLHRKPNLVPGDLVLIVDQDRPRGHWPLGLVEETFPDSQGCVRQVVVRTANQKCLRRDVRKICLPEKAQT